MGPGNETVYVVDDDRTAREALSVLLQANGKEVRMFNSGTEFLWMGNQHTSVGECSIIAA
jgi:FixJ family two-component response regulator